MVSEPPDLIIRKIHAMHPEHLVREEPHVIKHQDNVPPVAFTAHGVVYLGLIDMHGVAHVF